MGLCISCDATNREINKEMHREANEDFKMKKLLFLGAGGAGKSTIFKQLKRIHHQEMTEVERREHIQTIRQELLENMRILIKKSRILSEKKRFFECRLDPDDGPLMDAVQKIEACEEEQIGPTQSDLVETITFLWNHKTIQATWKRRRHYAIPECAEYFFREIDRVCAQGYSPDRRDILFARVRTTGIIETTFSGENNTQFKVVDVGGQRNERKKWAHCFSNVTAVIFVASLSSYCEVLFEDERKNGMEESLQIFNTVTNSEAFSDKDIILFLNKKDLFEERLKAGNALREMFPDYPGTEYDPDSKSDDLAAAVEDGIQFIQAKYADLKKMDDTASAAIYIHVTQATDEDNVKKVFWDVQNIVLRSALKKGHLL